MRASPQIPLGGVFVRYDHPPQMPDVQLGRRDAAGDRRMGVLPLRVLRDRRRRDREGVLDQAEKRLGEIDSGSSQTTGQS